MIPRIAVAALLCGLGFQAIGQKPQASQIKNIPDYVLYEAFFFRVAWLDDEARKQVAQGRSAEPFRSVIRKRAGLTSREEEVLKAIAADWRDSHAAIAASAKALIASGAGRSPQMQELQTRRQQAVMDHLSRLREEFGPARFPRLDGFVRATSNIRTVDPTSAPK